MKTINPVIKIYNSIAPHVGQPKIIASLKILRPPVSKPNNRCAIQLYCISMVYIIEISDIRTCNMSLEKLSILHVL